MRYCIFSIWSHNALGDLESECIGGWEGPPNALTECWQPLVRMRWNVGAGLLEDFANALGAMDDSV